MATNSVESILAGAKKTLADANNFTHSVTGNATNAFASPAGPKHISGIKAAPAHEYSEAPYSLAHDLKAKADNVKQYTDANPK